MHFEKESGVYRRQVGGGFGGPGDSRPLHGKRLVVLPTLAYSTHPTLAQQTRHLRTGKGTRQDNSQKKTLVDFSIS